MTWSRTLLLAASYVAVRWLRIPWRCDVCSCLVPSRRIARHAEWHYHLALTAWAAGGAKRSKPQRPVVPKAFGGQG